MGEQRASDRLKGEKICVDVTHLHHVTMATLHQQQPTKGEREGAKKEGESTMCWHVVLELSSELKQQEGKKDLIIERFCWTINRLVEIFLNKKRNNCDLKGKTFAKLQQALMFVNEKVMN